MAISAWPEGSIGEYENRPAQEQSVLNAQQLKKNNPIAIRKQGTSQYTKDVNHMANRIEASLHATSPDELEAGKGFYYGMHRAGRQIAMGVNPESTVSRLQRDTHQASDVPEGTAAPHSVATPKPMPKLEHDTRSAIAAIARTSPSQPRGMTWERNPGAVHEMTKRSDEEVQKLSQTKVLNRAQHGNIAHIGGSNIEKANELLRGRAEPQDVIGLGKNRIKVGTFYENGLNPWGSRGATIDARSHDIATGKRRGWEDVDPATGKKSDTRRIGSKGRYDMIEHAHQIVAERNNLQPHAVQAATWLADKRDAVGLEGQRQHRKNAQIPVGQDELSG